MKKTFQKTLIAASVGAVFAVASIGASAGTAGTTNLLFPYITTATGAYTFISIVNQKGTAATVPLHFTYATKATTAANSAACSHLDGDASSTGNDLMQFEISKRVDVPGSFGDTTSTPKYFPNTAAGANQHGILVVNNAAGSNYGSGATYVDGVLYGEARIINTATGLAAGYSTDDLHTTASTNPDFAVAAGPDGGTTLHAKVLSWFPDPTVTTTWYAVPTGTETAMAFAGGVTANYQVQSSTATQAANGIAGHYNNNEVFQSSVGSSSVKCVGTFTRASLLGDLNAPWSANGGWANLQTVDTAGVVASSASLVYKLETTTAVGGTTSFINRVPPL